MMMLERSRLVALFCILSQSYRVGTKVRCVGMLKVQNRCISHNTRALSHSGRSRRYRSLLGAMVVCTVCTATRGAPRHERARRLGEGVNQFEHTHTYGTSRAHLWLFLVHIRMHTYNFAWIGGGRQEVTGL